METLQDILLGIVYLPFLAIAMLEETTEELQKENEKARQEIIQKQYNKNHTDEDKSRVKTTEFLK